jgi:Uma2 family endonuclease
MKEGSMSTTPDTVKKRMTVDEFWEFVHRRENEDRDFELIRGEVVEVSRPTKPHGVVASLIAFELQLYARTVRKGYVVGNDSGIVLGKKPESVVGPDVAYFTDVNKFEDLHPKWAEVPPVLVVEVLSPNDEPSEVNEKIEAYLKSGVKVLWLVDYARRKVTVYRPERTLTVVKEDDELTGGDDLPGLTIKVADIFKLPSDRQPPEVPPASPPPGA